MTPTIGSRPPAATCSAGLEFRELRRSFGATTALDGLSLTINPGEMLALLGPSGCGKTTALRMVAGFERPDSGEVLVDGSDITGLPAHRRDVGMVFQSYSLFPHLTAADNVAFGMRMQGVPSAKRRARAHELLELVGLPTQARRYPRQLSGGQQQRVALARALALEPRMLLLDEPLSALDAKVRQSLRDEIRRLQQDLGITTLFVTHDQEEALSISDRVAVMRAGSLEHCATPDELYNAPATPFVAEFVGTMSRLPGRLNSDGTQVDVLDLTRPVQAHLPARSGSAATAHDTRDIDVLVRPEALAISAAPGSRSQVVAASFRGATTRLTVRLDSGREALADVPTAVASTVPVGSRVRLSLPERPVLIDQAREKEAAA
ncbi:ABC transporter ATP-binding protein [Saccharopolyspora shandongensis]|uniref:ABC transporter ATP-binding protein n=1 Tax=Saccharopolyspora shandongensis TaxID=418495 RepID=UPI003445140B